MTQLGNYAKVQNAGRAYYGNTPPESELSEKKGKTKMKNETNTHKKEKSNNQKMACVFAKN